MSAIYDALSRLNDRLIILEQTTDMPVKKIQVLNDRLLEKRRVERAAQTDLFGVNTASSPALDKAMLTRKLDLAIERVEQVLQEA